MSILFGACLVVLFAFWAGVAWLACNGSASRDEEGPWWFLFYVALTAALIGMCHWAHYVTM